jgi:hypothetical protein
MSRFVSEGWRGVRFAATGLVALSVVACGPSETTQERTALKSVVKEEDLYKYVGEGAAKKKVGLTIDERRKARGAATAKGSN